MPDPRDFDTDDWALLGAIALAILAYATIFYPGA